MNKPEFLTSGTFGQPLRRKEERSPDHGKGRFTDDFSLPGKSMP